MKMEHINFSTMDGKKAGNIAVVFTGEGWKATCYFDGDAVVNIGGIIEECETWTQAEEFLNDWYDV
jgi:hypothetical protein